MCTRHSSLFCCFAFIYIGFDLIDRFSSSCNYFMSIKSYCWSWCARELSIIWAHPTLQCGSALFWINSLQLDLVWKCFNQAKNCHTHDATAGNFANLFGIAIRAAKGNSFGAKKSIFKSPNFVKYHVEHWRWWWI